MIIYPEFRNRNPAGIRSREPYGRTRTHSVVVPLFLCFAVTLTARLPADIQLTYGTQQTFRYRHRDINVIGTAAVPQPVRSSVYQLNDAVPVAFYVKGTDAKLDRISRNRLQSAGDFNIEIPVKSPRLVAGKNKLTIRVTDSDGQPHEATMTFAWDPTSIPLPIDLTDVSEVRDIQHIGQIVNGVFQVDASRNVIRTCSPVAKDALLLLGSPHGSQEATYGVRIPKLGGTFLGLSDFFAGHEPAAPHIGIKPGWSSAGLATIRPDPEKAAQVWLAWGDLLDRPEKWVVKTDPPRPYPVELGGEYRVRHQVFFEGGVNRCRFRIWPAGESEPDVWLCEEDDSAVPNEKTKFRAASFGLFQYGGEPTEWFDIRIRPLRPSPPAVGGNDEDRAQPHAAQSRLRLRIDAN